MMPRSNSTSAKTLPLRFAALGALTTAAFAGALFLTLVIVGTPATSARATGVQDHDFVGADRCRSCHTEAYDVWKAGPHARAFAAMSETDRRDPTCLSCHTMVPTDLDTSFTAIQCETCHGGGRYYSAAYVMRDEMLRAELNLVTPDAKTCARCHTESSPSLTAFDVDAAMERIRHWPQKTAPKK